MKQAFWFLCVLTLCLFVGGALFSVEAQTASPTPDTFVVQLTSTPNSSFNTFIGDMSANGRFVVFTSNADIATERTDTRNNADGNREIFIADYAQRRIFQITNTKNVANPAASPSPTPTPSPSPSPTASPTPTPTPTPSPADLSQVKIQIDNHSPMISLAPALVGGERIYTIVFSSNAPDPKNFDGTEGTLAQDGNTEIWIYRFSAGPDVDLTVGTDLPFIPIDKGTFTQVTDTKTPSRVPRPGSTTAAPFYADDNREATISDDGNLIAFISTRDLVPGVGNADGNPELFLYNIATKTFTQGTKTQDAVAGVGLVFQSNPSMSADGSVVAFLSSANLSGNNNDSNGEGNAEVYVGTFSGSAFNNIRQVTRTKINAARPANVNVLSPGRRLSRDGAYIALESLANDPKANTDSNNVALGMFVYTIATDTFVLVGPRPTTILDVTRYPTFTDYNGTLTPTSLVFASILNFKADGTVPATADAAQGLNPRFGPQIFLTQLPASTTNTFVRMTNVTSTILAGTRPVTSDSRTRMAFALPFDFGGGNTDGSQEIFYLLSPIVTTQSAAVLSFFTGASNMPVATATPAPSPTPSPTPTPSPSPDVPFGLAPGELTIMRSTVSLAPSDDVVNSGMSETKRSPALPVELNGVTVGVNGAAAGLYSVGNTSKQINFVIPVNATTGLASVVVNINDVGANTDTALHGFVNIVSGQPDIETSTNDAGGRAFAFNVTNPLMRLSEPFNVTSSDGTNTVPTVIELNLTGVRLATKAEISISVGSTVISGDSIVLVKSNPEMPGFDIVNFTLPASLAGAGQVPIVVTFTRTGQTATTSRSAATAPHITIN